jgi:hypothetical protein
MKRIPLGTVKCGRRPNQTDRRVADLLIDCLYAPTQVGVSGQVGRARVRVANMLENNGDKDTILLEDADHTALVAAINGFVSIMPDEGLYEAFDLALKAETAELPN